MNKKEQGWFMDLLSVFPESPGILLLLIGLLMRYWAIKGEEWMYDTGGPGIFSNITWVRNTFGEAVAQCLNLFIAWGIILVGLAFIALGIWLRVVSMIGK